MSGNHSQEMRSSYKYTTEKGESSSGHRSPQTTSPPKRNRSESPDRNPKRSPKLTLNLSPILKNKERGEKAQGPRAQKKVQWGEAKHSESQYKRPWSNRKERDEWKKRVSVVDTFVRYKAKHNTDKSFCGFYWHSWRLAKKGTDKIFDEMKAEFQGKCTDGKIEWADAREMLFKFKKEMDKDYRSMLWHFRFTECEKCAFWDEVYKKHMANVHYDPPQELSDAELLEAVAEIEKATE
ncbi:NP1 protein [Rodent bocavirus]|uniref:Non-structural protein NP-1 n=1 Tax=Rodent bocavirus TaxID=2137546 RepID=A0A2Z3D869_9VIRU|nr:NP1 protein [Rodent bocavirus]AVR53751.1 NP1 protein [Rodent bocavirus]